MTNIYVVAHKPYKLSPNLDECYKLIRVGKYAKDTSINELADSTGDNISEKNPNYCELTAMYWIWKNDKNSDIVGLCHYRRYFTKKKLSIKDIDYIKEDDVVNDLSDGKYDVIAPRREYVAKGLYRVYLFSGYEKDIEVLEDAVKVLYPEYLPFFYSEFINSCSGYFKNMLIMKKPLFDAYCKWLFDILSYVESKIDISGYPLKEARIFGYMSERLFGVWLAKNNLRVKEYRIINTEEKHGVCFFVHETLKNMKIEQKVKRLLFQVTQEQN